MTSASVVAGGNITITLRAVPAAPNDISLNIIVTTQGATYSQTPDRTDGDYHINPLDPFQFTSENSAGGGNLEVRGTATLSTGKTEITLRFVTALDDDTESESVVFGLLGGDGYTPGTIRQVNLTIDPRQPPLPVTTTASTTPAPRRPGAPSGLTATAASVRQIDLSWNAPADDGDSPITGYRIQASEDGGISFRTLEDDTGDATTGYSHTGLTGGVTRHYLVFAINAVGVGAEASAMATTFPATVPGKPELSAVVSGVNTKTLTWMAPDDGGSPIIRYILETQLQSGASFPQTFSSTARSYGGVQTVSYRVRAENEVGAGAWSALL